MALIAQAPQAVVSIHRAEQRYRRILHSVPLTFHLRTTGKIRAMHGISLDLSEGGVGALLNGNLPVGELVKIDVPIGRHSLSTLAIVRHASARRSGFEFLGLTAGRRQEISNVMGRS